MSPDTEGRPPERPPQLLRSLIVRDAAENLRSVIVKIAEALEDGDIEYAYSIAQSASEPPIERRLVCECGARFEHPGEVDHHLRFAHEHEFELELEEAVAI
jgi:hypothetical protein